MMTVVERKHLVCPRWPVPLQHKTINGVASESKVHKESQRNGMMERDATSLQAILEIDGCSRIREKNQWHGGEKTRASCC